MESLPRMCVKNKTIGHKHEAKNIILKFKDELESEAI